MSLLMKYISRILPESCEYQYEDKFILDLKDSFKQKKVHVLRYILCKYFDTICDEFQLVPSTDGTKISVFSNKAVDPIALSEAFAEYWNGYEPYPDFLGLTYSQRWQIDAWLHAWSCKVCSTSYDPMALDVVELD